MAKSEAATYLPPMIEEVGTAPFEAQCIPTEDDLLRQHVCEILEGGQEAFEKREQKYDFSQHRG